MTTWRVTAIRHGREWYSWHSTKAEASKAAMKQRARGLRFVSVRKMEQAIKDKHEWLRELLMDNERRNKAIARAIAKAKP